MPSTPPIAILDLGTAKTTVVVLEEREGLLRYAGRGQCESRGMRKAQVINLEFAAEAIRLAVEAAERSSGLPIERVFLSLTGAQPLGLSSQAGVALTSRSREITREDARRALELARDIQLPEGREILHVVPQEFVLDGQGGVRDPVGMLASRLEARAFLLTVASAPKQNLVIAANRAGLEVEELVFAPLATADVLLRAEDRQLGAVIVDVGAGCTSLMAFAQGAPRHAAVIPVGGEHFTNDLAIAFNTPRADAEKLKCFFGAARADLVNNGSAVEVPGVGDRPSRTLPRRRLCECLESRARELAQLVRDDLERAGLLRALGAGVLLAGGGSRLAGFAELLETTLELPVHNRPPVLIDGMPDDFLQPEFAFAVGAGYYSHRVRSHHRPAARPWERWKERLLRVLDES